MQVRVFGKLGFLVAGFFTLGLLARDVALGQSLDPRSVYYKRDGNLWHKLQRTEAGFTVLDRVDAPVAGAPGLLNPSPGFAPYRAYPTGSWPEAVAVADVNGDGRNDVVMTTSFYSHTNDSSILLFFQNASRQLNAPVRYAAGAAAVSVRVADFTGDGRNDIAVGRNTAGIRLFIQAGNGDFSGFTDYPTANARWICSADFNNDGRSDLAGIGWGSRQVDVFTQTEAGTMMFAGQHYANYSGYNDIEAGDVNHDGLSDIVVMNGQTYAVPNLSVLIQTNGSFAPAVPYDLGGNELTQGVGVGDVTGDGRNDIVVSHGGNQPSPRVAVFRQTPSGGMAVGSAYPSYDIPEPVAVTDVNLDGLIDVVTVHGGWNRIGVYLQGAPGGIQAEQLYPVPYASHYNAHGLAVGDMNGDEMPDLVIADYNNGLVVLTNCTSPPAFRVTSITVNAARHVVLSARYRGGSGSCTVEACDTLPDWSPVGTMTAPTWIDTSTLERPRRFYRLVAP